MAIERAQGNITPGGNTNTEDIPEASERDEVWVFDGVTCRESAQCVHVSRWMQSLEVEYCIKDRKAPNNVTKVDEAGHELFRSWAVFLVTVPSWEVSVPARCDVAWMCIEFEMGQAYMEELERAEITAIWRQKKLIEEFKQR